MNFDFQRSWTKILVKAGSNRVNILTAMTASLKSRKQYREINESSLGPKKSITISPQPESTSETFVAHFKSHPKSLIFFDIRNLKLKTFRLFHAIRKTKYDNHEISKRSALHNNIKYPHFLKILIRVSLGMLF